MKNYSASFLLLLLLLSIKSFGTTQKELPQSIESENQQQTKKLINDSHKLISLLYAFMNGNIRAQQDKTVQFGHYNRPKSHYSEKIQTTYAALQSIHALMMFLRTGWQATPLELDIAKIHYIKDFLEKKQALIAKLSSLTEEEKAQLECARFHVFMTNADLKGMAITENERLEIINNRDALKKAFMPHNASDDQCQKINESAARKLNPQPKPNISEFIKEKIEAAHSWKE